MNRLICLVLYVSTLVASHAMAADYCFLDKAVDRQAERVGGDHQSVARPQTRIIYLNRTAGDYTHVSQAPPRVVPKPTINAGWVKCPCENCNCVIEDICKNGNCNKNYAVFITAKWCRACPRMKVVAEQLRKDGYIVYVVDYDEAAEKMAVLKITHVPTTLVFDGGKETKRFVGVATIEDIRNGLKKKSEQPGKKPAPQNPYNFK